MVINVKPGSRSEAAGLAPGMIITAVNGKPLAGLSPDDIQDALDHKEPMTYSIRGKPDIKIP